MNTAEAAELTVDYEMSVEDYGEPAPVFRHGRYLKLWQARWRD